MRYSPVQYARALRDLATETPDRERRSMLRRFIGMLETHRALGELADIVREYRELEREGKHIRSVVVKTPERESEVSFRHKLPFKAEVDARRDVRLRGGAIIEVGDVRVDNSISRRLEKMREVLAE